ncbi:MAG: hypothetical protein ABI651_17960 [Verrucomicrobiota bacterium]
MKSSIIPMSVALAAMLSAIPPNVSRADAPVRVGGGAVNMFVTGPGGSPIPPLDTPLFGVHCPGCPITAPDGHQIMLGEWVKAQMTATVRCIPDGTHVEVRMTGLIPNGVYTIWVLVFNGPFDPTFSTLVGGGSLGANDGSQNSFKASANGQGQLVVNMPPTTLLAIPYDVKGCLLDEVEVHLVGVYHSDGMTYGPVPGYAHSAEVQFGVPIKLAP